MTTEKTWHAPVLEELSIPAGTEGGKLRGINDDNGADDGTFS